MLVSLPIPFFTPLALRRNKFSPRRPLIVARYARIKPPCKPEGKITHRNRLPRCTHRVSFPIPPANDETLTVHNAVFRARHTQLSTVTIASCDHRSIRSGYATSAVKMARRDHRFIPRPPANWPPAPATLAGEWPPPYKLERPGKRDPKKVTKGEFFCMVRKPARIRLGGQFAFLGGGSAGTITYRGERATGSQ